MTSYYDTQWKELGLKLKRAKKPYLNPTTYEQAYPERVRGHAYYRKHPELLTAKKCQELREEFARWAVGHIRDGVVT